MAIASFLDFSNDVDNSLIATNYELASRKNEMRLDSAIEKLRTKKSFEKKLIFD